jgi:hypothetical protein
MVILGGACRVWRVHDGYDFGSRLFTVHERMLGWGKDVLSDLREKAGVIGAATLGMRNLFPRV